MLRRPTRLLFNQLNESDDMATAEEKMTSVTLPRHVRNRLRDYQIGGKSAAEAIQDLMDEVPPDYFRRDLHRALLLPRDSVEDFRKSHRLPKSR